jgi:hypothetical protein
VGLKGEQSDEEKELHYIGVCADCKSLCRSGEKSYHKNYNGREDHDDASQLNHAEEKDETDYYFELHEVDLQEARVMVGLPSLDPTNCNKVDQVNRDHDVSLLVHINIDRF